MEINKYLKKILIATLNCDHVSLNNLYKSLDSIEKHKDFKLIILILLLIKDNDSFENYLNTNEFSNDLLLLKIVILRNFFNLVKINFELDLSKFKKYSFKFIEGIIEVLENLGYKNDLKENKIYLYYYESFSKNLSLQFIFKKYYTINKYEVIYFVLGMHRSGTSALTGLLASNCLDGPLDAMNPSNINKKGFYESEKIVSLNENLLTNLNIRWDNIFEIGKNWNDSEEAFDWSRDFLKLLNIVFKNKKNPVIKDPRLSILIEGLKPMLEIDEKICRFLIIYRNPLEVAFSLNSAQGTSLLNSLKLWIFYNISSEFNTRNNNRIFIHMNDLINYPSKINNQFKNLSNKDNIEISEKKSIDNFSFIEKKLVNYKVNKINKFNKESIDFVYNSEYFKLANNIYNFLLSEEKLNQNIIKKFDYFKKEWELLN